MEAGGSRRGASGRRWGGRGGGMLMWRVRIRRWGGLGGWGGSNVEVGCRNELTGGLRIDVVALGKGEASGMVTKRWNGTEAKWEKDWGHGWGVLKGSPAVVSQNTRVDYLAVGV